MTATSDKPAYRKDAWKPIRRGDNYCSPACGRPCTWEQYQAAIERAAKLAAAIGPDWKPDVWENLGWHWRAISPCGRIKVHPNIWHDAVTYTAFVGEPGSSGGRWAESGKTPQEAIEATLAIAKAQHDYVANLLKGLI